MLLTVINFSLETIQELLAYNKLNARNQTLGTVHFFSQTSTIRARFCFFSIFLNSECEVPLGLLSEKGDILIARPLFKFLTAIRGQARIRL